MKNEIDFIYEYSDLNLFQTRVKVLTGRYKDLVLEYGSSTLAQCGQENTFTFQYTIYEVPESLSNYKLKDTKEFEEFLAYLLVDVIKARNEDKYEKEKLDEAASSRGKLTSDIKISEKWYPNWRRQPIAQGLQGF